VGRHGHQWQCRLRDTAARRRQEQEQNESPDKKFIFINHG